MNKRTRLKITWYLIGLFSLALVVSIFKEMEGVAAALVTALAGIGATYNWGETKRPSVKAE